MCVISGLMPGGVGVLAADPEGAVARQVGQPLIFKALDGGLEEGVGAPAQGAVGGLHHGLGQRQQPVQVGLGRLCPSATLQISS